MWKPEKEKIENEIEVNLNYLRSRHFSHSSCEWNKSGKAFPVNTTRILIAQMDISKKPQSLRFYRTNGKKREGKI